MQPSLYQNKEAITLNELMTVLTRLINNKIDLETFSLDFVIRFLRFLNNTEDGEEPPRKLAKRNYNSSTQERKYQRL